MRALVVPPGDRTFHITGDSHVNSASNYAYGDDKHAQISSDLTDGSCPVPLARWHVGDLANTGIAADDTKALAWADTLPVDRSGRTRFHGVSIGNHDVGSGSNQVRTGTAAAAGLGLPGINYTRDYPGLLRLIVLGFVTFPGSMTYEQATLDHLTASLEGTSLPCAILCHAPLKNTVTHSTDGGFWFIPEATILSILNSHANAKLWVCGHTHTPKDEANIVKLHNVGSRNIVHVNAGSPFYDSDSPIDGPNGWSPTWTMFLTYYGTTVEFRARDHYLGRWTTIGGSRVKSFTVPA